MYIVNKGQQVSFFLIEMHFVLQKNKPHPFIRKKNKEKPFNTYRSSLHEVL